jgi:hypothetical protein
MSAPPPLYDTSRHEPSIALSEEDIEYGFIGKRQNLNYEHSPDNYDRALLETNFGESSQELNTFRYTTQPKKMPLISRFVFVTDHKNLNCHNYEDFDMFQESCIDQNTMNTAFSGGR